MKLRNKSGIIAAVAGLTAVSLLSVGFASWVLSATDTTTQEGSIQVETVDTSAVFLIDSVTLNPSPANFKFGTPSETQISGYSGLVAEPWLTFDDAGTENLTVVISLDVQNVADQTAATAHVELTAFTASAGYADAVTHNYVAALPAANTIAPVYNTTTNKVDFTITLSWGSAFGGKNPYEYFNTQTKSSALINEANTKLNGIATDLASVTYSVTIVTK